jgi:H+/gluconate symporter-like permease
METKEHIFLFIPIMAAVVTIALFSTKDFKEMTKKGRTALGLLAALVFLTGFSMAFFGFLISSGARAGLAGSIIPAP